jgi:chromosomal replication initiation ATPase DnaA
MSLLEALHNPAARQSTARRARKPKNETAQLCWLMESAIAAAFAVPVDELRAPTRRSPAAAFARQAAMYLAHVVLSQSYSATGRLFHRDRTTAAYACALVEDRRDDPVIDNLLQTLENVCDDLARGFLARPGVRS